MLLMDSMSILLIVQFIFKQTLESAVSYNQPNLCPNVSWNPNAITLADNNTIGLSPFSLFINRNNTVYVTSWKFNQILMSLETSENWTKINSSILLGPFSLFVTITGDIYIYNSHSDDNDDSGPQNVPVDTPSIDVYPTNYQREQRRFCENICYCFGWFHYCCWFRCCVTAEAKYSKCVYNSNNDQDDDAETGDNANNNQTENSNNHGRVYKLSSNATNSTIVMNINGTCAGLFIINNTIYCSVIDHHQVVTKSLDSTLDTLTITAGNGSNGSAPNMLNKPQGIFVNTDFNLYVADCENNRIQRFGRDGMNGETVAGNKSSGSMALLYPTGVALDSNDRLFIVDSGNHRIVELGANGFRCLVGCINNPGSASDALSSPWSLSFDSHGNIFVTDWNNVRIQKFLLVTNSCAETATTSNSTLTTNVMKTEIQTTKATTSDMIRTDMTTRTSLIGKSTTIEITRRKNSPSSFVPPVCIGFTSAGISCEDLHSPCKLTKPCQNNASCTDTNATLTGYACLCSVYFNGSECQNDHRPCKPDTCWNNGTCVLDSNEIFKCQCERGWHGRHCQTKIDYCDKMICLNNGVCRSLFMNYTCECLGDSYSGRHCEISAPKIVVFKIVSKSFAYVAIIAMISAAMFIVIMDVLKYCFDIDPVREERERIRQKKQIKKRKPFIQRFVYINTPPSVAELSTSTIKEITV